MISTESLTKRYGSRTALDGLTLAVGAGEIFGLIGPNGAGKTTTLKILATLLAPTSGTARIDGLDPAVDAAAVRRRIGWVPDAPAAWEDTTVEEYLRFFAAAQEVPRAKAEGVIGDALELTDLGAARPLPLDALSRGMRQRLEIARVLLHDPAVLLLDEPSSGLDPHARVEMRELLRELGRMGKTIVISSHVLPELAELCGTVGILEGGRLLFRGPVADLVHRCRRPGLAHARVVPLLLEAGRDGTDADAATARACACLGADPRIASAVADRERTIEIRTVRPEEDPSFIPALLVHAGLAVHLFREEALTLEEAFLRLTRREEGSGAARGPDGQGGDDARQ